MIDHIIMVTHTDDGRLSYSLQNDFLSVQKDNANLITMIN